MSGICNRSCICLVTAKLGVSHTLNALRPFQFHKSALNLYCGHVVTTWSWSGEGRGLCSLRPLSAIPFQTSRCATCFHKNVKVKKGTTIIKCLSYSLIDSGTPRYNMGATNQVFSNTRYEHLKSFYGNCSWNTRTNDFNPPDETICIWLFLI